MCQGATWDSLGEDVLCAQLIYERLAHYLVCVYLIDWRVPLACSSFLGYMGTAPIDGVHLSARHAKHHVKHDCFFVHTC